MFVRPIDARSCFRRGEAEARITRLLRTRARAGSSRGGGGLTGILSGGFGGADA